MALSGIAEIGTQGMAGTARVESSSRVTITFDNAYPAGGYTTISTLIKAVIGTGKTITSISQETVGGGYLFSWDRANDTLLCYEYPTAIGPATELATATALAAVSCEFRVNWV